MSLRAKRTGWWLALLVAGLCVCPWAALVHAAEIKVLSAGAMKGIVTELAETFRQETGNTVIITSGTAGELRQKVEAGEVTDVVIVTDTVLEQHIRHEIHQLRPQLEWVPRHRRTTREPHALEPAGVAILA